MTAEAYLPIIFKLQPAQTWLPCPSANGGFHNSLVTSHHHRAATPGDLVSDLVYVVLLQQLGEVLRSEVREESLNLLSLRDFVEMFMPIWFQWNAAQMFLNRFELKGVLGSLFYLVLTVFVAKLGVDVQSCGRD
eukprot:SAG25_NODE_708_length_5832_cov_2.856794_7_plen_133_part_01